MPYEENPTADQPFGFLMDSPAGPLIDQVRQMRAARMAAADRVPTFGEVSEERRAVQAEEQQMAAELPATQAASAASEIKFLVDTTNGEFEPVLPGQEDPQPGPREILVTVSPDGEPNVLAQGKRVTSADVARLGQPGRGVKPTLRSSFQLPPEFQQLAESLGITQGGATEEPAE